MRVRQILRAIRKCEGAQQKLSVPARVARRQIRWPVDSRMQIVAARNDKLTGHSYGHWLIAIYLQISRMCAR